MKGGKLLTFLTRVKEYLHIKGQYRKIKKKDLNRITR
jgi:hypothetical protein